MSYKAIAGKNAAATLSDQHGVVMFTYPIDPGPFDADAIFEAAGTGVVVTFKNCFVRSAEPEQLATVMRGPDRYRETGANPDYRPDTAETERKRAEVMVDRLVEKRLEQMERRARAAVQTLESAEDRVVERREASARDDLDGEEQEVEPVEQEGTHDGNDQHAEEDQQGAE